MLYWAARGLIRVLASLFLHWSVEGEENVPATGPVLLAINHVSAVDPLLGGSAIRRKVHFMAKEELFRSPLLGWFIRQVAAFPVRRGEGDRQAIKQALSLLQAGEVVGIFPEGTRSPDGRLQQPQTGIAFLAKKAGATVVPMALTGTQAILPKGAGFPRPAKVRVLVGRPLTMAEVEVAGEAGRVELRRFAGAVMAEIQRLIDESVAGEAV